MSRLDGIESTWHDECTDGRPRQMTFAEIYCATHRISPDDFESVVLRRTLRPLARVLYPLLDLNPDYFAADRQFIGCVGRISQIEQLKSEAIDFVMDSHGRGFLHQTLKLRVSRQRLNRLVRAAFENEKITAP